MPVESLYFRVRLRPGPQLPALNFVRMFLLYKKTRECKETCPRKNKAPEPGLSVYSFVTVMVNVPYSSSV